MFLRVIFFLLALNESGLAVSLDSGVDALEEGSYERAKAIYEKIGPRHSMWPTKLLHMTSYHLFKKNYQEAYRISEFAKLTTELSLDQNYLGFLAATFFGACPIRYLAEESPRKELLFAFGYRFASRYGKTGLHYDPFRMAGGENHLSFIGHQSKHRLMDIPTIRLQRGAGCSLVKKRLKNRSEAKAKELSRLRNWYHFPGRETMSGDEKVHLRIVQLANSLNMQNNVSEILEKYREMEHSHWTMMSDPTREAIWTALLALEDFPAPPFDKGSLEEKKIKNILLSQVSIRHAKWLGLVQFHKWDLDYQNKVLNHLLSHEEIEAKHLLRNQRMLNLYYLGQTFEAVRELAQLRSDLDDSAPGFIANNIQNLAILILKEYSFDMRLLGAVQNATDADFWGSIFKEMIYYHSLSGNKRSYYRLIDHLKKNDTYRQLRIRSRQKKFLDALVRRKMSDIDGMIDLARKNRQAKSEIVNLTEGMTRVIGNLPTAKRKSLKSFSVSLSKFAIEVYTKKREVDKLRRILSILDPEGVTQWRQGALALGLQDQNLGAISLRSHALIPSRFKWTGNSDEMRENLLVVPSNIAADSWVIE